MRHKPNSSRGFTLLEMMISAAIGLVMVCAAAQLYSMALQASFMTSQKAELQQDFRAASNLLQRDLSMAGAGALGQQGISTNQVGLPTGTPFNPVYPCNGLITCNYINAAPVAYPTSGGSPYLYSIIPGPNLGIIVNAAQGPTDIITVVSADVSLALNCYTATIDPTGTIVTFQLPNVVPSTCVLPTGTLTPQPLNAAVIGLQAGDMILFGTAAMGVVTSAVTTCPPSLGNSACYTVTFGNNADPGHINQTAAVTGSLAQFVAVGKPPVSAIPVTAVRLLAVTYYLDISPSDGVTPRLMRIQNGKPPAPVAENVVYLKFTYDVNNNGVISSNQATLPAGTTPSMITKINIAHMSMRSQEATSGGYKGMNGFQGLDLQTSISARNMTSQQEYPITGSSY